MTTTMNPAKTPTEGPRRYSIFESHHHDLREAVRRFVEKEINPHADEWEETTWPNSIAKRMGELGFLGLSMPVEYGGQGGDYICNIVLTEELRRSRSGGLGLGMAVHTDMAMPPINAFGSEEQKQEWLVPAIAGDKILCLGISEPDAGSDVARIRTHAVRDGDDYIINGSKTYITNGHRAHGIVLIVKTDPNAGHDGFSVFLVDMDLPGVIREKKLEKLGMSASDTALLAFQDVRVPARARLGDEGGGFRQIMWELQGERVIAAAGSVARAQMMFDMTLEYAKQRTAFGQRIGTFQAIRHKFADMAMKIEAARHLTYATAARFGDGEYPVRDISMTKLYASQVAWHVADTCLQIYGGAGYMKEYDIERMWRDTRLARIGAGTDEIMLDVIGKSYGL